MKNEEPSRNQARNSGRIEPRRFVSVVQQFHREAQQRRAQADHEKPHEAALVKVTRRLVTATYVLAIIAACSLVAVFLQWDAMRNTDKKTGRLVTVMQGQLDEMQADSAVTRAQLRARMRFTQDIHIDGGVIKATAQWQNIGKTDAVNFTGWDTIGEFNFASLPPRDSFLRHSPDIINVAPSTVEPTDGETFPTETFYLPPVIDDYLSKKKIIVWWGYA